MDANVAIGIGLALGFAGCGVGIGQGIAVNGALNGMARQPDLSRYIATQMLIGLAFPELVFLLTFLVGFLLMSKVSAPTNTAMLTTPHVAPQVSASGTSFVLKDGRTVSFA